MLNPVNLPSKRLAEGYTRIINVGTRFRLSYTLSYTNIAQRLLSRRRISVKSQCDVSQLEVHARLLSPTSSPCSIL